MVNTFEKSKGLQNPRGLRKPHNQPEEAPKPKGPVMMKHGQNKIREKNKYLDQWGPLGW